MNPFLVFCQPTRFLPYRGRSVAVQTNLEERVFFLADALLPTFQRRIKKPQILLTQEIATKYATKTPYTYANRQPTCHIAIHLNWDYEGCQPKSDLERANVACGRYGTRGNTPFGSISLANGEKKRNVSTSDI